jgi:hypothetical protein
MNCRANETGAYRHTDHQPSQRVDEAAFFGGVSYVGAAHSSERHLAVRRHLTASSIRNRDDNYSVYGQGQPFQGEGQGDQAMKRVTRDDITKAISGADEVSIAQIIGTGATVDELAEAQAWLANDEPMMNSGRPLATGRVRELVDILAELEPDDDEDGQGAPAAVSQE